MTTGLPDHSTTKLHDYLDRFVTYLVAERDASPYTVKNYSHEIGEFIEFAREQGVTQLEQIDRNVLRLYLTWLAAEKKARGSIARRLSELRSFGKFLVRQGIIKANIFDVVSAPKLGQRLPEYLEHDEATALVTAPDTSTPAGLRDRAILEVMYAAGLRVSELVGLNIDNVDLARGQVRVWGKGGKERVGLLGSTGHPCASGVPARRSPQAGHEKIVTGALFESTRRWALDGARGRAAAEQVRPARRRGGPRPSAPAAAHLRHAPARRRRGFARGARTAWATPTWRRRRCTRTSRRRAHEKCIGKRIRDQAKNRFARRMANDP